MSALTIEQALHIAMVHHQAGRHAEADAIYRQLLAVPLTDPGQLEQLGLLAHLTGRDADAVKLMRAAIDADPHCARYYNNFGLILHTLQAFEEAEDAFQSALRLQPNYPYAFYNLGNTCHCRGKTDAAIAAYRAALSLQPDLAEAHGNLGASLQQNGDLDGAFHEFEEAMRYRPDWTAAYLINLGNIVMEQGQIEAAVEYYRRGVALDPSSASHHSHLLLASWFHPDYTPAAIAHEHAMWHQRHEAPLIGQHQPHLNDRSTERRLRVGYVSADFRDHVIGRNVLPLIRAHDRKQFEVFCYSGSVVTDKITERFQALPLAWRNTARLSDDQLAAQIRADRIDLLVDLNLHLAGGRLLVFARKPAPVQVTFAGYPGTTGLQSMDYRLTDRSLEPSLARGSEAPAVLPGCFWCFDPIETPAISPLPASTSGHVTFGCLNNFSKVNRRVLALWSRVLREIPNARLLLLSAAGSHREHTLAEFERAGVRRDRIEFTAKLSRPVYLALHHRIDVILDTYPYNGHTTTCDALWMGVPVVSRAGETSVSRGGLSLLTTVGLPELVADTDDGFVRIAVGLASDLPRLAALRANLRTRMQGSPLMDLHRFTRDIEAAYRTMWRRWCGKDSPARSSP